MPGEAEISFEEATGVVSTPPHASPVSPSSGEISFAEAAGPQIQRSSVTQRMAEGVSTSFANRRRFEEASSQARGQLFTQLVGEEIDQPSSGFWDHAGKTALRGVRALIQSPTKAAVGGVKALAGGAISMGESAVAGIRGLGRAAGQSIIKETLGRVPAHAATAPMLGAVRAAGSLDPVREGVAGIEESLEDTGRLREMVGQITKVNLAAENEQEQAMESLLMLMPEGIAAAGDTVYEKTGSALAGAGTQGILTLLTFKPGIAGKVVDASVKSVKSKELFNTTFDALAVSEPDSAKAIIDHVAVESPKTAQKLRVRMNQATGKWEPVELGEKVVKEQVKGKEITAEEAGIGLSETAAETPKVETKPQTKPAREVEFIADEETGAHVVRSPAGEILTQENRGYLQIKRSDVLEAERGKGHAQEMMQVLLEQAENRDLVLGSDFSVSKDAVRVYEALKRKGFYVKENPNTVNPNTGSKVSADPRLPVYEVSRPRKATEGAVAVETPAVAAPPTEQIFVSGPTLSSIPGGKFIKGKLTAWWDELIRAVSVETLGPKAKQAAAVLGEKIAERMNKESADIGLSAERLAFWEKIPAAEIRDFMKRYEKGQAQVTAELQKIDQYLRDRGDEIYKQDQRNGIKYDPIDNYLYHVFKDSEKLARYFEAKYGKQWGNPKFTKNRAFDFYEEAINAGFEPRFTNPEDIILARQQASDLAQMRVELLRDLESYGLAVEKTKANPGPPKGNYNYRRSPNGKGYWVEASADAVLYNAFDTKTLWSAKGVVGDIFKGFMFLKNHTVPAVLSVSLFHPLHLLLGMDSAATMTRLTKEMVVSGMNPVKWFGKWLEQMALGSKGIPFYGIIDNPKVGFRLLQAVEGKLDPTKLTAADLTALQYMNEGGFAPVQPVHMRANAMANFRRNVRKAATEFNGKGGLGRAAGPAVKATLYSPFAIIDAMQYPMFRLWIPALKIASYLKDVQTALKLDPTLAQDKARRILAFRKLSKSVDNRYGEMNYNTLFWNRLIKDTAVANMLSLGWNLGFAREYGGGAMDLAKLPSKGKFVEKVKAGELDRPLFVMFYTTQVMLYSGLITWAMTGQLPTDFIDYLYPKSGDKDAQGKDIRLTTPFYPREFSAIAKHVEHEGLGPGMWHVISNKASGVLGLVRQWATGVDWRGHEFRDPNSPWHQQMRDTLGTTLQDLEPISIGQLRESKGTTKDVVTSITGFNKAPKYVTQSSAEAQISVLYRKYYAPQQTPYETAVLSDDRRKLAKFYEEGDTAAYSDLLDEMATKYHLTATEQGRLARNIMNRGVNYNPYKTMFERLSWQQQKRLLDEMSAEEREIYLPVSNREHLRYSYQEPE